VKSSLLEKLRELLPSPNPAESDPSRSAYERFALPHSFKPSLTFLEALVSIGGALLRIFFGSLLFAVWGTYTLQAWNAIHNSVLRVATVLTLFALFAILFASLMYAILMLVKSVWPHRKD
jgi:hypothetical protein